MNEQIERICPKCGKPAKRFTKGTCHYCYRKTLPPKLVICKRCGELKQYHAKGLCRGCYNSVFFIDVIKEANYKKNHKIKGELYHLLTRKCALCKWDIRVELHHIDGNHKNRKVTNLVGLCPNHHAMAKDRRYKKEIQDKLRKKGYHVPDDPKDRFDFSM